MMLTHLSSRFAPGGHTFTRDRSSIARGPSVQVVTQQNSSCGQAGEASDASSQPRPHLLQSGLLLATTSILLIAPALPSHARLELPNKEVDDATSPYVQKLLKRTEENKERYAKERLQDYYRRNFKEYFEFEASNAKVAKARGLSTQSQEAIAKWLEDNK